MEIETVRGSYSQFSSRLDIKFSDGNTTITSPIYENELINFARMLLEVADDCITKVNDIRHNEARELINDALSELSKEK